MFVLFGVLSHTTRKKSGKERTNAFQFQYRVVPAALEIWDINEPPKAETKTETYAQHAFIIIHLRGQAHEPLVILVRHSDGNTHRIASPKYDREKIHKYLNESEILRRHVMRCDLPSVHFKLFRWVNYGHQSDVE